MTEPTESIYSLDYLRSLFDEMSGSYDRVNYLTSFGFSQRFRRQFIQKATLEDGFAVCDLMCGGGECWPFILPGIGPNGTLLALDMSPGMLAGARHRLGRHPRARITVVEGNAFETGIENASMDRVLVAFGLKTLADEFRPLLASEVYRILRPGGAVSFIELTEPRGWSLRPVYMWYLKSVVPMLGRILLGNPENYRMLGVYTERFQGCELVVQALEEAGFDAELVSYFHGCATGVVGRKPDQR